MLDDVSHIIQVALTPVFLLTGIGSLLNVFSTRLGRVADQVDALSLRMATATGTEAPHLGAQLAYLRKRSKLLDIAVVLASTGAGATCLAALVLFVGALRDRTTTTTLFAAFGVALICAMVAVAVFVVELLIAGRGLREKMTVQEGEAEALSSSLPGQG